MNKVSGSDQRSVRPESADSSETIDPASGRTSRFEGVIASHKGRSGVSQLFNKLTGQHSRELAKAWSEDLDRLSGDMHELQTTLLVIGGNLDFIAQKLAAIGEGGDLPALANKAKEAAGASQNIAKLSAEISSGLSGLKESTLQKIDKDPMLKEALTKAKSLLSSIQFLNSSAAVRTSGVENNVPAPDNDKNLTQTADARRKSGKFEAMQQVEARGIDESSPDNLIKLNKNDDTRSSKKNRKKISESTQENTTGPRKKMSKPNLEELLKKTAYANATRGTDGVWRTDDGDVLT